MKRISILFSLAEVMQSLSACDLVPAGFGASVAQVQSSLAGKIQTDLPKEALQSRQSRPLSVPQPSFRLVVPGRQVCPVERLLDHSFVTFHFAFDHLFRVEVRRVGNGPLKRLAQAMWGPALRSKRVAPDPSKPLFRWKLPSAYVTYRGKNMGNAWHETLDIQGKGQQAHVERLYGARRIGEAK